MMVPQRRIVWLTFAISFFGLLLVVTIFIARIGLLPKRICRGGEVYYIDRMGNGACLPKYSQGPCPPDMVLVPLLTNRSLGACHCDNFNNERTLVFDNESDRCYFVFTQGFCPPDYWITVVSDIGAQCVPNYCKNRNQVRGQEWVPLGNSNNGSCVVLGKTHKSCKSDDEVIKFFKRKLYPACTYNPNKLGKHHRAIFAGVSVPQTDCPEGYYKTELGHCAVEFDDS